MVFSIFSGAISGFFAVALGAFGAHALKATLSAEALGWFHTAVEYQMFHAAVLIALGSLGPTRLLKTASCAFTVGTIVFCGSLYALALTGERKLGMVTPIGGVSFLVGWACLAVDAYFRFPKRG